MISEEQLQAIHEKLQALKESGELNGEGADRSENLHRLFIYPAMMVPAAQHALIEFFRRSGPIESFHSAPE